MLHFLAVCEAGAFAELLAERQAPVLSNRAKVKNTRLVMDALKYVNLIAILQIKKTAKK